MVVRLYNLSFNTPPQHYVDPCILYLLVLVIPYISIILI